MGLCGLPLHARTASSVKGELRCGQGIPGTLTGPRLCLAPLSVEGKETFSSSGFLGSSLPRGNGSFETVSQGGGQNWDESVTFVLIALHYS